MSTYSAVESLLMHLRERWRARDELASLDSGEVERMARELGLSSADLEKLVERGPDAASLLYERMRVLGISRADVENAASGLMRDLERTCACCNEKGVCEKDLKRQPSDPAWKSYCPNVAVLEELDNPETKD